MQHLLDLTREFESEPMLGYRKALAKWELNKGTSDAPREINDTPSEVWEVLEFFEKIGMLVRHGYLDTEDTWTQFSDWVFYLNQSTKNLIKSLQSTDHTLYSDFTQLNETLMQVEKEKGGSDFKLTPEQLSQFWAHEAGTAAGRSLKARKLDTRVTLQSQKR